MYSYVDGNSLERTSPTAKKQLHVHADNWKEGYGQATPENFPVCQIASVVSCTSNVRAVDK